jgi:hypothetical protein
MFLLIKDSKKVNCSNTPERNSYYCLEHIGQDVNLTFKLKEDMISFKVNQIVSSVNTMLYDVTIHDCFRDKYCRLRRS